MTRWHGVHGTEIIVGSGSLALLSIGPTSQDSDLIDLMWGLGTHLFQNSLESFLYQLGWKSLCSRENITCRRGSRTELYIIFNITQEFPTLYTVILPGRSHLWLFGRGLVIPAPWQTALSLI